ncbi:MAG: CtsR family transcriptional regulator [Clostridia bacterium]|nr:CtsR family transcriptional regulator [Clostridia bacterium]MDE7329337.1 CtsR family transcriptional regulator [Clostridia bacterium]
MANISDEIEQFILSIWNDSDALQLSRNDLAQYFSVAPSQINYVLATRFSFDKGYIIESKRGGGGFITLLKINDGKHEVLQSLVQELENIDALSFNRASNIIQRLEREGIIDSKESEIIKSAISDKALSFPAHSANVRKNVFKEILIGLMRR